MRLIRVLVVEDSLTVRQWLVSLLQASPEFEVVGEARDGEAAIEMCRTLRPDVMTLDIVMPGMSGVAVTEQIMAFSPTPIVVVSGAFNRGELFRTYDALAAGALEVLEKPSESEPEPVWAARLLRTLRLASKVKVITHPRARLSPSRTPPALDPVGARTDEGRYTLVALGASTGGPNALRAILRALPRDFPLPVVVVVHIGGAFAASLAAWLDREGSLPVRLAVDGEPLPERGRPGVVLAPGDRHLIAQRGRLWVTETPPVLSCRPSVNLLFESLAAALGPRAIGGLLTGMGRDGASGLAALRRAGAMTLAQDEASSVVYGMPREAALLGAAARILPLDLFPSTLVALAGDQGG
ncbi:MAG: chemotaxis-specific protein-glutamate methyltransferase CheB [Myxococcales bacterium]|nr:chemotaxis-specific protein-glutamate methyltransferase CheB [Myxococcales bacterium]